MIAFGATTLALAVSDFLLPGAPFAAAVLAARPFPVGGAGFAVNTVSVRATPGLVGGSVSYVIVVGGADVATVPMLPAAPAMEFDLAATLEIDPGADVAVRVDKAGLLGAPTNVLLVLA